MAYELELPSRLKKALRHNVVFSSELPPLAEEGKLILILEAIIDFIERALQRRTTREYLVKWKNFPIENATWESKQILQHSDLQFLGASNFEGGL